MVGSVDCFDLYVIVHFLSFSAKGARTLKTWSMPHFCLPPLIPALQNIHSLGLQAFLESVQFRVFLKILVALFHFSCMLVK